MRVERIKAVWFKDGVQLGGTVRQSLALQRDQPVDAPRDGGVFRVADMQPFEYGLGILMSDRWFLVPWAGVSSCEVLVEVPVEIETDELPMPDKVRVDPVMEARRTRGR